MALRPCTLTQWTWPRPIAGEGTVPAAAIDWDVEPATLPCTFRWMHLRGEWCWGIDWRQHFSSDLKFWNTWRSGGMTGFYVVFHVTVEHTSQFEFWASGGGVVLRNGHVVCTHGVDPHLTRVSLNVAAGDRLTVAQWSLGGEWLWAAVPHRQLAGLSGLTSHLARVCDRLRTPTGPALKTFVSGKSPLQSALAIYSMVLNGYAPSQVFVYGEHQWAPDARDLLEQLLPFAVVVPTRDLEWRLENVAGRRLLAHAHSHWGVMKTCATLLTEPSDYCLMDDDIFVLDTCDDALEAWSAADLVFSQDADYSNAYLELWGTTFDLASPIPTGRLNTGLYWCRGVWTADALAARVMQLPVEGHIPWIWEQGFMAAAYARSTVQPLSRQRYFYPYHDGLPGGVFEYPYSSNPCGFASIHFGGLREKPRDAIASLLADAVLAPRNDRRLVSCR